MVYVGRLVMGMLAYLSLALIPPLKNSGRTQPAPGPFAYYRKGTGLFSGGEYGADLLRRPNLRGRLPR